MTNLKNHLKRVQVNGFKSIADLDLKMNPINILIGANGSGKSNFISLFSFLRHLSEGKLQTYIEKNGFANTFFHFGAKKTEVISLKLDVGDNGYHVDFVHGVANDTLVFQQEFCTFTGSLKAFQIKGKLGESGLLPDGEADSVHVRKYTREYLSQCRVYHFHDTSPTAAFKQAQKLSLNTYLLNDAANLGPFLYLLKQSYPANYQEILAAIQTVAPFFHDFYLVPQGQKGDESILLRWMHRDHDTPFSANQLSDGTARFICLATLFLQPEELRPNTIVLDEPELGLHPAALEVLAEIIEVTAKKTQVICSTQSVTFKLQEDTKGSLEQKMFNHAHKSIQAKLVPYVQMYEFEGLLFTSPTAMHASLNQLNSDADVESWASEILSQFGHDPEKINDSPQTAPSKRLENNTNYRKTTHGPNIAKQIGIAQLREKCEGFDQWLDSLEALENNQHL